jgi:hypothetical protein
LQTGQTLEQTLLGLVDPLVGWGVEFGSVHFGSLIPWDLASIYSKETAALFRESTHVALALLSPDMKKNADGTVDIYFGPAPAGHESNWLYTPAGQG